MRRAHSIRALVLALVVLAVLGTNIALELQRATPSTSPRDAVRAATQSRAAARDERFRSQDRAFSSAYDTAMIRDRVVWRATPGDPPTTDVTIVNATPDADLGESARACATAISRAAKTRVQCYAYADSESYAFKNITGEMDELTTPTAIVNLCYAVMASNERAGGPITLNDMRPAPQVWEAQGCPDSWPGSAPTEEAAP